MDADIQFGDVAETQPERQLRPDRNRHFAVAALGSPQDRDLPIFIDLDVLREIESHALADTSVELGGVLLGGQHEDEQGRPFVVITDSLRAVHYESTKGSFKFTHDTWSAITRERDGFPAELAMVGWYHTHPDWGVFLSGMDMFICDNFFNKKLDVAYVVDPCQGDRGMFQWTGESRPRVRRTGGFYVMASRFRGDELEQYVLALEGRADMPANLPGYPPPVIHISEPRLPWFPAAVLGSLALQFCLVALIAWKTLAAPAASEPQAAREAARQTLQLALEELRDRPEGYVNSLEKLQQEKRELASDLSAQRITAEAAKAVQAQTHQELEAASAAKKRLEAQVDRLAKEKNSLSEARAALAARVKELESPAEDSPERQRARATWWIIGGAVGTLALGAAGAAAWNGAQRKSPPAAEPAGSPVRPADEPKPA